MKFIPYQKLVITTDLPKEDVMNRLKDRIGPIKYKNFARVDKNIFSGKMNNDKFELTLNKDYRNSWTPKISVKVLDKGGSSELIVTLRCNNFIIVFTSLFIIGGLSMLVTGIAVDHKFDWAAVPFTLLPCVLSWFGFNLDAEKSINGLLKITKGEIM